MEKNIVSLPREIDLDKSIALNIIYQNALIDLENLPRLKESCVQVIDPVLAKVSFTKDLNGIRLIKGQAETTVQLICQRCNELYSLKLYLEFELSPDLEKAKAFNLENKYDFIDFNQHNKIDLYELIEDGLILEIPAIPMHEENDEDCARQGTDWSYGEISDDPKSNPFAALADLKASFAKQHSKDLKQD